MNIKFRVPKIFLIILVLTVLLAIPVMAEARIKVVRSLTEGVSPWVRIDCLRDTNGKYVQEPFHPGTRIRHSVIRQAFGTDEPNSDSVLLHFAPGWDNPSAKVPVLLVHGAATQAFHSWTHPYHLEVPAGDEIEKPGLMQYLSSRGFSVFAVTFSHYHGDNFLQAQQIANAIEHIRKVKGGGSGFKVDIVCHSKGAMPTRIYLSDLEKDSSDNWRTRYRKDVRKCIFIGSPLKGLDTPFRYYAYNLTVVTKEIDAPLGVENMLFMGLYLSFKDQQKFFPGQYQMLHNWAEDGVPLTWQSGSADFNLSRNALYFGGMTALLRSRGLDYYKEQHGDVIARLNASGIAPDVKVSVIAGSKQAIDYINAGFFKIPVGEMAAESDGVVFLKSSTHAAGLTSRGALLERSEVLDTHHVGLIVIPASFDIIGEVLGQ